MLLLLKQIEASDFSRWLSESESVFAFPGILVVHTLGMALGAGGIAAVSLRLLGVARQVPLVRLRDLLKVAGVGLALSILSGVLLLLAYPTKALTNPIFYLKLLALGAAVAVVLRLDRKLPAFEADKPASFGKWMAATLMLLTTVVIVTGRLLPYTFTHLFADG